MSNNIVIPDPTPPPKPQQLWPLHPAKDPKLLTFYDMPYVEQLKWALRYADRQLQQERERSNHIKEKCHYDKHQLYKLWEQQEGQKLIRLKEIIAQLKQENAELAAAKQKVENELLALQLYVKTINHNQ